MTESDGEKPRPTGVSIAGADDGSDREGRDGSVSAETAVRTDSRSDAGLGGNGDDTGNGNGDDQRWTPAPIEPEDPSAENALFVVLGVIGTVLLLVSAVAPGLI
ncbi:DUF7312 domain-containing protein [Halobellus captivus]|uniref:DUF7312 domain-containing protein n=1 Tax=Halobellus captivus TaxID=2592614 RepID=UPI0011A8DD9B|nr:hypothetical protein [Halobellus captivus]